MDKLKYQRFEGYTIRVFEEIENYYHLRDISKVLGLGNSGVLKKRLTPSNTSIRPCVDAMGRNQQQTTFVNAEGLIEAVSNTKKRSAQFKSDFLFEMGIPLQRIVVKTVKEAEFLSMLEEIFKPMNLSLIQQYHVEGFNVDAYVPEKNMVIEYDENGHKHYDQMKERERERKIVEAKKCKFVRLSDHDSHLTNIGIVMNALMSKK